MHRSKATLQCVAASYGIASKMSMNGGDRCCTKSGCCQRLRSELHYRNVGLHCEESWKAFDYCPVSCPIVHGG